MERKVIGSYCICNTASINIYEIDNIEDRVLVGMNNNEPQWVNIDGILDEESGDYIDGFVLRPFGFIPFNEVMRV